MIRFRFGPPQRPMYGALHPGNPTRNRSDGVVMCNPWGQEAVRINRIYRVLADRLARRGLHVLRFDYFATGESMGEDEQGEMLGWRDDILVAHEELMQRAACRRVTWFGARLGACLAAQASVQGPHAPHRLLLWEPLVDGHAYLAYLRHSHARAVGNEVANAEMLGFGLAPQLALQLQALGAEHLLDAKADSTLFVGDPSESVLAELAQTRTADGRASRFEPLRHSLDWTSDEALNAALVPSPVVAALETLVAKEPA